MPQPKACKKHPEVEYLEECRKCHAEREKARYHANPDKMRDYFLNKNYGLTREQYDAMLEAQGGTCAICRNPPTATRMLDVDHCHGTQKVRGLLCTSCNNGLGRFKDNPELLKRAAIYLEENE